MPESVGGHWGNCRTMASGANKVTQDGKLITTADPIVDAGERSRTVLSLSARMP